jgi:hypothetical protein
MGIVEKIEITCNGKPKAVIIKPAECPFSYSTEILQKYI